MIAAYSPQARGRSERFFGTLLGRLPQEPERAGITEAGERVLEDNGNHADSSVFVYKDLSDDGYYTQFPHRDLKGLKPVGPLHSTCDTIF